MGVQIDWAFRIYRQCYSLVIIGVFENNCLKTVYFLCFCLSLCLGLIYREIKSDIQCLKTVLSCSPNLVDLSLQRLILCSIREELRRVIEEPGIQKEEIS